MTKRKTAYILTNRIFVTDCSYEKQQGREQCTTGNIVTKDLHFFVVVLLGSDFPTQPQLITLARKDKVGAQSDDSKKTWGSYLLILVETMAEIEKRLLCVVANHLRPRH